MPSSTPKQARTMRAAAHNPEFAAKMNIPQGVARDFEKADKRKAAKKNSGPAAKPYTFK